MLKGTRNDKNIFDELTGIRAIAAYMVYFHHNNMFSKEKFGTFLHNLVNEMHIGVTVFFVLSGFLICYRYYDNINLKDLKWIVRYIQNRVARIYPMYFLMTTITFLIIFFKTDELMKDIGLYFMHITFLRGFFKTIAYTGIGQGWTLTVEECFYFSAPFIFLLSKKVKLIVPFLFIFLFGVMLVMVFREIDFYGFFINFKFMLSYTFFGRWFEFFTGIMLALLYKNKTNYQLSQYTFYTYTGALWILLCLTLLVFVKGKEQFGVFTWYGIIINNTLLPFGIAFLFLGLIQENTIVKRILASKLFVLLGKSSYTFYLIHMSFISYWVDSFTGNTLLSFVLINIISILLFKFIEEPSNLLIRNIKLTKDLLK